MIITDKRTGCLSALITTNVADYLELSQNVYSERGGIEGQRAPLKTKTGIRIRKRMVEDIAAGTILPPLVVGVILTDEEFDVVKLIKEDNELISFLKGSVDQKCISIIDGMQRTTAILEANIDSLINENPLRIEFWLAKSINSLIYRMLVLNTGQVPWDIKRQLETIYQPILKEITQKIPGVNVLLLDSSSRRSQAGQYQSSKLIELFLAFASRKINVEIKEKIAEDFARMEASEATANEDFLGEFIRTLKLMSDLDAAFDRHKKGESLEGRINSGKDIFSSAPAGIGFMASAACLIYGPPGFNLDKGTVEDNLERIEKSVGDVISKLQSLPLDELESYLDLLTLNQKLATRSSKVGDFERDFFFKSFDTLFKYGDTLPSMEPCWVAR